jgi:hypothetical protein
MPRARQMESKDDIGNRVRWTGFTGSRHPGGRGRAMSRDESATRHHVAKMKQRFNDTIAHLQLVRTAISYKPAFGADGRVQAGHRSFDI